MARKRYNLCVAIFSQDWPYNESGFESVVSESHNLEADTLDELKGTLSGLLSRQECGSVTLNLYEDGLPVSAALVF